LQEVERVLIWSGLHATIVACEAILFFAILLGALVETAQFYELHLAKLRF